VNNLFIRLYLDEDVHVLVADLLQARRFDVVTTRDVGKPKVSDAEQLAYAVSQNRALVTHNRTDFEALVQDYFAADSMHYGVIYAVHRSPHDIAKRLLVILNHVTAEEMQNQVRYI